MSLVFSVMSVKYIWWFTFHNYCFCFPFGSRAHYFTLCNVAGVTWTSPWFFLVFLKIICNLWWKVFSKVDGGSPAVKLNSKDILFSCQGLKLPIENQRIFGQNFLFHFYFSEKNTGFSKKLPHLGFHSVMASNSFFFTIGILVD